MEEEETRTYDDFTTASELEIFIARLEEIIIEWGLNQKPLEKPLQKDDFKTKEWGSMSEDITFSEAEFRLYRYYLITKEEEDQDEVDEPENAEDALSQGMQDMMSTENDFCPIGSPPSTFHPLARWYGLREFLVLTPQRSSVVASESRVKILLSSISIAAQNTKCGVPFFMRALEPWQRFFLGVHQFGSYLTEFDMVHLKRTPPACRFLTGLISMFKSKIGLSVGVNPVTVSARFTYVLQNWTNYAWKQSFPCNLQSLNGSLVDAELGRLPLGSLYDSISELYLSAFWLSFTENSVVDGENYTDLVPLRAPIWKASVTAVTDPMCMLTDYYCEFLFLMNQKYHTKQTLGSIMNFSQKQSDLSSPLNILTESKITTFSKAVIKGEKAVGKEKREQSDQNEGPISSENLMTLLYYLFPDADPDYKHPYPDNLTTNASKKKETKEENPNFNKKLDGMKSAPYCGLLWRLSILMLHVMHSLGGFRCAVYLWYEFTQELRYRWENGILIEGLPQGAPDLKYCLLHQKLQLLNCCIARRKKREESSKPEDNDSETEDEFYDCFAEEAVDNEESVRVKVAPANKPLGRLSKHENLRLLETGEPLYVPVTQDEVFKTEDQMAEDEKVLLELGTDSQSSELRAELMSPPLVSDMESFKAANPGCILEDFIRWYSPRDWIEDESGELDQFQQRKGHLSKRMQIPGNIWLEAWRVARPIPAKWQKRLFDDTREAEKVLNFLEWKNTTEIAEVLLPVIIFCVIHRLLEEAAVDELPGVNDILAKLIKKAEMLRRLPNPSKAWCEDLVQDISAVETLLTKAASLKLKFMGSSKENTLPKNDKDKEERMKFIKGLLAEEETEVPGGPQSEIGSIIKNFFLKSSKVERMILDIDDQPAQEQWNVMSPFPSPFEKEIILRLSTVKGPQRLHAILCKNEFRLCGAFTRNIYLPL